ncbi:MAG: hypothetical protein U0R72_14840 [Nakamurella multipartita]|jgi:hypothetical protein
MTTPIIPPDRGANPFDHPDAPTGPVPVIAPDAMAPGSSARSRAPILLAVIGVLTVALGVVTALWVSTSNQLAATESAKAATPNLIEVAERHLGDTAVVTGDSDSVSVVVFDSGAAKAQPGLRAMLDELGFSSAVLDRMGQTRALDGTRDAEGRNCNVTWTYHPDDGLQMVFEAGPVK